MKYDIFKLDNLDNNKKVILDTLDFDNRQKAADYVSERNKGSAEKVYFQTNYSYYNGGVIYDDGYICRSDDEVDHWFARKIAKLNVKAKKNPKKKTQIESKIVRLKRRSHSPFIRKLVRSWDKFCDFWKYDVWWRMVDKFKDWRSERRRIRYFKKNHHDIRESWSLDTHLLEDLRWNLKILIEESHGYSTQFIVEVVADEHKDDPNFNVGEWMEKNPNPSKDIDKKAMERMKQTYAHIIHLIDLYEFYDNTQLGENPNETKTPDMQDIIYPGTLDEIDYAAMYKKAQEYWNEIWDMVKKYGQGMWD